MGRAGAGSNAENIAWGKQMSLISKATQYIKHPLRVYSLVSRAGLTRFVPDEQHLRIMYRALIGKRLDLDNPQGFNEKLNWLKLHDRNPALQHTCRQVSGKEVGCRQNRREVRH